MEPWEIKASRGRKILLDSIPTQWLLSNHLLPTPDRTCVIDVPKECGLLSDRELTITETTATGLVKALSERVWTAEEVVVAFLKRGVIGHQLTNFATEFLADEAIARAKELDAILKDTGKIVGPLHGVPISLKEFIGLKDKKTNGGFVAWIDNVSPVDADLVVQLRNAGAIPIVRTNEPQSLMHLDTNNNITGKTCNPHNLTLSAGGSSGGEGVSIGFKCTPLGIGTDIGGSIRVPAAFNGTYGLRPTVYRLSRAGLKGAAMGQESVPGVNGPLANSIEDIELFMKSVLDQEPWEVDCSLAPVPWRSVGAPTNITVGLLVDDGVVRPHPPLIRALEVAHKKLTLAGIRVVDWKPFYPGEMVSTYRALMFPDNGRSMRAVIEASGEPLLPLTEFILSFATDLTVGENWALNHRRNQFRAEYHANMKAAGVDFILSPTFVGVAPENGTPTSWSYTSIWNLLDHPALVFPTGLKVDQDLDLKDDTYQPRSTTDSDEYSRYTGPKKFMDAPICLQLAGKRFHDEELLAGAKIIAKIIQS